MSKISRSSSVQSSKDIRRLWQYIYKLREWLQGPLLHICIELFNSYYAPSFISHLESLSLLILFILMTWSTNIWFLFHCKMLPLMQIPTISHVRTVNGPNPSWLFSIYFRKGVYHSIDHSQSLVILPFISWFSSFRTLQVSFWLASSISSERKYAAVF